MEIAKLILPTNAGLADDRNNPIPSVSKRDNASVCKAKQSCIAGRVLV